MLGTGCLKKWVYEKHPFFVRFFPIKTYKRHGKNKQISQWTSRKSHLLYRVNRLLPFSAILGPRQCGKTTIAGTIAKEIKSEYFDLENPVDLTRLENPMFTLEGIDGLAIIDEIQRKPDLFPILRVIADRNREKQRFHMLSACLHW